MSALQQQPDETKFESMIRGITRNVRKEQLRKNWYKNADQIEREVRHGERHDPLLGWCRDNSLLLAHRLAEQGYEPHIIWGAIDRELDRNLETVADATANGYLHFWVEIPTPSTNSDMLIAEIASEYEGGVRVTTQTPSHYTRPEQSRLKYDEDIVTTLQLSSLDGYEHLKSEGLVIG